MAYIPSGLVSLIFGLAPLLSGLMAARLLGEPGFSRVRLGALALALAGLGVVFKSALQVGGNPVPGLLACLMAVLLFSLSGVLVKRQAQGMSALEHTTGSLLFSLPLFACAWWFLDGEVPSDISSLSLLSLSYLALFGSVLGFMLYFFVLQKLGATQVALIPLITPVFALALGSLLAGEQVSSATISGGVLILLALSLYQAHGPVARAAGQWASRLRDAYAASR
jgi:drug/metabolite transporter (DMT)-like permease